MNKEEIAKAIDVAADGWMEQMHRTVGGRFDRHLYTGRCALCFKNAVLPLLDNEPVAEVKEEPVESADSAKRKPGRPKKIW